MIGCPLRLRFRLFRCLRSRRLRWLMRIVCILTFLRLSRCSPRWLRLVVVLRIVVTVVSWFTLRLARRLISRRLLMMRRLRFVWFVMVVFSVLVRVWFGVSRRIVIRLSRLKRLVRRRCRVRRFVLFRVRRLSTRLRFRRLLVLIIIIIILILVLIIIRMRRLCVFTRSVLIFRFTRVMLVRVFVVVVPLVRVSSVVIVLVLRISRLFRWFILIVR